MRDTAVFPHRLAVAAAIELRWGKLEGCRCILPCQVPHAESSVLARLKRWWVDAGSAREPEPGQHMQASCAAEVT